MENDNKSVKDERVSVFIKKHQIKNARVMYLIWFGFQHNLSEEMIELFATKELSAAAAEAKYMAVMLGLPVSTIGDIRDYSDIRKKLLDTSVSELMKVQDSKFQETNQRLDILNEKMNLLAEKQGEDDMENGNGFFETEKRMEEFSEKVTTELSNMESGVYESIDEVKGIMIQCVESLLELSESNLSLLRSSYEEQELLHSALDVPLPESIEKELNEIKSRTFEWINSARDNIVLQMNSNPGKPEKKSFLSYFGKVTKPDVSDASESTEPYVPEEKFAKKQQKTEPKEEVPKTQKKEEPKKEKVSDKEADNRKSAGIQKYNEIVARINDKEREITVIDFLNLIRTGLFDKEQADVITTAIQKKLTIPEIIEIAKPEQSAEVMEEILSFLLAAKEGEEKKEVRQEKRTVVTSTVNKRKVPENTKKSEKEKAVTTKKVVVTPKSDSDSDDADEDFNF